MCAANRAPSGALQAAATAAEAEERFRVVLLKIGSNLKLLGLRPSIARRWLELVIRHQHPMTQLTTGQQTPQPQPHSGTERRPNLADPPQPQSSLLQLHSDFLHRTTMPL